MKRRRSVGLVGIFFDWLLSLCGLGGPVGVKKEHPPISGSTEGNPPRKRRRV